jgi:hypothetical protein
MPCFKAASFQEAVALNDKAHLAFRQQVGLQYAPLPYVFLKRGTRPNDVPFGDFTSRSGQRDYFELSVEIDGDRRRIPCEVKDIFRFAELVAQRQFFRSQSCMCLRGLKRSPLGMRLVIGCDRYHEAFFSVGCDNMRIALSERDWNKLKPKLQGPEEVHELKALQASLIQKFGEGTTVRRAIHSIYGGMPDYDKKVYSHIMGCAAVVITADMKVILGLRTPERTAVNFGFNVPVSGAFDFHDEEPIERMGFPMFAMQEALREGKEEVGLSANQCSIIPTGLFGDCTRAGTPDFSFLILSHLTAEQFIARIAKTTDPMKRDADVFATLSLDDARKLVTFADAPDWVHHKFLVTLIMALRALDDSSVAKTPLSL